MQSQLKAILNECKTHAADKFLDCCSLANFASKEKSQRMQLEKHRSATIRHMISGTRRIAAANVRLMLKFMKSKGMTGTSAHDLFNGCRGQTLEQLIKVGVPMF